MQPAQQSALHRELHPDDYDRSRESQVLEVLAVLVAQVQLLMGNQSGVKPSRLPGRFEDLLEKPKRQVYATEEQLLAEMAAFDRLIGRG